MAPTEASERGNAYEIYAVDRDRQANERGRVTFSGDRIPPLLVQHVRGNPATVAGLKEAVQWMVKRETENFEKGRSPHFGMDGLSVMINPLHRRNVNALLPKIIEVKSTPHAVDCHEIGPNISLMTRCICVYGPESPMMPKLRLLATHKPTKEVYETFVGMQNAALFEFAEIPMPRELAGGAGGAAQPDTSELRLWQRSATRVTIKYLAPKASVNERVPTVAAKWDAACGSGKTRAALEVLREASWANVKIFVAHKPTVAAQLKQEAMVIGITTIDLTCTHTYQGVPAVEGAGAGTEGNEKQCARIIQLLEQLAARATSTKPVYLVLCHYTLTYLASTAAPVQGPATKHGSVPKMRGARKSIWSGVMARLPLGQQLLVVVDEWHKVQTRKDVFDALFADPRRCKSVFMTGTEYNATVYQRAIGKRNAEILKQAKTTGRQTMSESIKLGYLVHAHAETVFATDDDEVERDSANASLSEKIDAAAAWIVANSLRTASVYCSSIDDANKVATELQSAIERDSGGSKAWVVAVHSKKSYKTNKNTLKLFKKPKQQGDADYRVVTSVAMLEEGFNFPALDACILFAVPDVGGRLMQIIQRCMRASPGKTVGRILLFGDDQAACNVARLLHKYDPDHKAISLGATPASLQGHVDAWTNARGVRDACERKAKAFKALVKVKIVGMATLEERVEARAKGFLAFACAKIAASIVTKKTTHYFTRGDSQTFKYKLRDGSPHMNASQYYAQVRSAWHHEEMADWIHDEALRARFRALPFWIEPDEERAPTKSTKVSATQRAKELYAFHEARGYLPLKGGPETFKDRTAHEKSVGLWMRQAVDRGSVKSKQCIKVMGCEAYEALMTFYHANKNGVDYVRKYRVKGRERVQELFDYFAVNNCMPSKRSKDPYEKKLGIWLGNVIKLKSNDSKALHNSIGEAAYSEFLAFYAKHKNPTGLRRQARARATSAGASSSSSSPSTALAETSASEENCTSAQGKAKRKHQACPAPVLSKRIRVIRDASDDEA